jgi:hypothetical protein
VLIAIRRSVAKIIGAIIEVAGALASLSGATAALVLGKVLLAIVLAALALGFFLRFTGRRAKAVSAPAPTPPWVFASSVVLSLIEVAALVEATNLPVRFNQPGFEKQHWLSVLLALIVAFVVQVQLFRALQSKSRAETQP